MDPLCARENTVRCEQAWGRRIKRGSVCGGVGKAARWEAARQVPFSRFLKP